MRYWWVNQNQTFEQETQGGYLWSPKRKSNGHHNPFYEFMREVSPGDIIFSFARGHIPKYGIAKSYAYEAPKPDEFGNAGRNWNRIGWRVDASFENVYHKFRPKDWIHDLRPFFPAKYAPLTKDGNGIQSVYLTELPETLAFKLADLIGDEISALVRCGVIRENLEQESVPEILRWEEHLNYQISSDKSIPETEREAIVLARRGQGRFKENVRRLEQKCRITQVERIEHLRASHCKPWRDANNRERLDGENGLLLTPTMDHLFDRGFLSFHDDGRLLISPVAHEESLRKMNVPFSDEFSTGIFEPGQARYLEYHRDEVFLKSQIAS